jgi:acetylornithine deacetylase/succinyl-diaminopimelate desuccinylase-like protein
MTDFATVDQSIDRHLQDSLDDLRRLVSLPSFSNEGATLPECAEHVAGLLTRRGFG